jgi:hypothetical protein
VRGYVWQLFAGVGWTSLPWLHRMRMPVLILHADDDPIVPLVNAKLIAWRLPDATLEIVPRGDHLFLLARRSHRAADRGISCEAIMTAYDYPLLIKNLLLVPTHQPTRNQIVYRGESPPPPTVSGKPSTSGPQKI